jgi:methyl halide transferase
MAGPNQDFWQQRFETQQTPWDRQAASPQLLTWLQTGLIGADTHVLVPGCGSSYELVPLARHGCRVTGIDYAPAAIARANQQLQVLEPQQRARVQLAQADVLHWSAAEPVDLVYEQTCLCALHPDHWIAYAAQLRRWLRPGGSMLALFAQAPKAGAADGLIQGPPFHCDINAMRALFAEPGWRWPKPPYPRVAHPMGMYELALVLQRS